MIVPENHIERFWKKVDRGCDACWLWKACLDRCVLHSCDVRNCVNPAHLFLGTNAENTADKVAKNRQAKITGEEHPCAVLSEEDVREIRSSVADGVATKSELARRFGVVYGTIHAVCARINWRKVV